MEPTLTWLDLTAGDRDRMRRVLDLFTEQGTLDEMGIGSLRDTLSKALFPGTSYLQTRLRYALFIPWIYRALEDRRIASAEVAAAARRAETGLIGPLETDSSRNCCGRSSLQEVCACLTFNAASSNAGRAESRNSTTKRLPRIPNSAGWSKTANCN